MQEKLAVMSSVKVCVNDKCTEGKNISLAPWASTSCSALYTDPPVAPCASRIERLDLLDTELNVIKSATLEQELSASVQQVSVGNTGIIRVVYVYRDTSTDEYSVIGARLVCKDATGGDLVVHFYQMSAPVQKTASDVLVVNWTIDLLFTVT